METFSLYLYESYISISFYLCLCRYHLNWWHVLRFPIESHRYCSELCRDFDGHNKYVRYIAWNYHANLRWSYHPWQRESQFITFFNWHYEYLNFSHFPPSFDRMQQTISAWRIIFFVTIGLYVIEIIVYTLFGSGEEQPWNKSQARELITVTTAKPNSETTPLHKPEGRATQATID